MDSLPRSIGRQPRSEITAMKALLTPWAPDSLSDAQISSPDWRVLSSWQEGKLSCCPSFLLVLPLLPPAGETGPEDVCM